MDGASDSQLCAEVYKRGGHLLETGEYFDCKFLVGVEPQEEIASHKLILSMASRVFEALFKDNEKSDLISVEDIQPEIFKLLLQYIYTGSMKVISIYDACDLYSAAKKYMLQHLLEECRRYLMLNVTSNVWQVLKFAQLHEDKELLLNCESIFATYTQSILNDINFEDADLDTVITVFSHDTLSIDSETQLIKAAARYAEAQNITVQEENTENNPGRVETQLELGSPVTVSNSPIKKSSKIRRIAEKIRFLRLTPNQFAELSERNSILTLSEQLAVIMNQASTKCNVPLPSGFSRDKGQRHMFQKVLNKEGSFTYTVYGFTHLDSVLSPPFYVLNLPWQLKYVAKDENDCRRLSIVCSTQNNSTWSCEVNIVIKIFNPASVNPVPQNALAHWNSQHSSQNPLSDFTFSATLLFCRQSSAYFFSTDTVNWGKYINKDGSVKFTVEIKKKEPEAKQMSVGPAGLY